MEAGLPNITGSLVGNRWLAGSGFGAFRTAHGENGKYGTDTATTYNVINFNASWSNSIYGNADTVIPQSVNVPIVIYLGK